MDKPVVNLDKKAIPAVLLITVFLVGMTVVKVPALSSSFAYVTNELSDSVSVIDVTSNIVVANVAVGNGPRGISLTPDGTKAYLANCLDNTVSVIDTATNTVDITVAVGNGPNFVAITPDGAKAYVTNSNSDNISVIDTATNTVTTSVEVRDGPMGIAVTPDGSRVYAVNDRSTPLRSVVSVINTTTDTVTAEVEVGFHAIGIAITPDGTKAYVTNSDPNSMGRYTVSVIDISPALPDVIATVEVDSKPVAVAITPNGTFAYVAHPFAVSVIDTATDTVATTFYAGSYTQGIAITPDGTRAFLTGKLHRVYVIDILTNTTVTWISQGLGDGPYGVAVTPLAPTGSISGSILLNGRTVVGPSFILDLYDSAGNLTATITTTTGTYSFPDVEAGIYSVALITPVGYGTDTPSKPATVEAGKDIVVSFDVHTIVADVAVRSMGYWKHEVNSLITGIGHADHTKHEMKILLEDVQTFWDVFDSLRTDSADSALADMASTLNAQKGSGMQDRAKQQLLALLLNVASGKVGTGNAIDLDRVLGNKYPAVDWTSIGTVGSAVNLAIGNVSSNPELAKDVADVLNNGEGYI